MKWVFAAVVGAVVGFVIVKAWQIRSNRAVASLYDGRPVVRFQAGDRVIEQPYPAVTQDYV